MHLTKLCALVFPPRKKKKKWGALAFEYVRGSGIRLVTNASTTPTVMAWAVVKEFRPRYFPCPDGMSQSAFPGLEERNAVREFRKRKYFRRYLLQR